MGNLRERSENALNSPGDDDHRSLTPPGTPWSDLEGCLALHLLPGLGPVRFQRLLARFGTIQAILTASAAQLQEVEGINQALAAAIRTILEQASRVKDELTRVEALGGACLAWTDPAYPPGLRSLADPPPVLFVRGTIAPSDHPAVAVVGTRRPTPYGLKMATQLAAALAEQKITTISGLARGIDGAVHHGSLHAGGRTLAVLGHGLDQLYPAEHHALADRIVRQGAVVTEFFLGAGLDRTHFPRRNRIIAGLAVGVVVVEADLSSGALITAQWALEQGREVFAVPGPVGSPASRGTHQLLRWGATLVESVEDILEAIPAFAGYHRPNPRGSHVDQPAAPPSALSEPEQQVLTHLSGAPLGLDAIQQATHLPFGPLAEILLALQMKRLADALPGQRYVRSYG